MSILKKLFRYWYVVVAFTVIGALLGVVTEETQYQSEASLMFKLGREHLYQPEFGNRQPIASTRSDMANAINTETHIMSSEDVLRAAVRKVGVVNILSDNKLQSSLSEEVLEQHAIELLSEALSIRAIDGTNVLKLSLPHESPEVAKNTLNAIIDVFLSYRKELYSDSSLLLMQKKLKENQISQKQAEEDLQRFSVDNDIYSYDDQLASVTKQLIQEDENNQSLSAQKNQTEVQLQLTLERIKNTAKRISLYTDTATNSVLEDARSRKFELQVERNQLRGKYHDNSERVTQLRNEIAQLDELISAEDQFTTRSERMGRNPALNSLVARKIELENQRDAIVSRQESLKSLIKRLREKRSALVALSVEYERKKSVVTVLKERQLVYLDEVDKAELAVDVSKSVRSGARVLQRASFPTTKAGITGLARIRLSAFVGFLLAIAMLMGLSILKALELLPSIKNKTQKNNRNSVKKIQPTQAASSASEIETTDEDQLQQRRGGINVLGKIARA